MQLSLNSANCLKVVYHYIVLNADLATKLQSFIIGHVKNPDNIHQWAAAGPLLATGGHRRSIGGPVPYAIEEGKLHKDHFEQ